LLLFELGIQEIPGSLVAAQRFERLGSHDGSVATRFSTNSRVKMVDRFVDAWERAEVSSVVAMLAHDATITMPPRPTWYGGQDAVASFLRAAALAADKRWRLLPVNANGQPAVGEYLWNERKQNFAAEAVTVLTIADNLIADITSFRRPDLFAQFGLPDHLEP
jgi:RNA polymerase sigma-70 factor, ECF subfamily